MTIAKGLEELSKAEFTAWTYEVLTFWGVTIILMAIAISLMITFLNREMRRIERNRQLRNSRNVIY